MTLPRAHLVDREHPGVYHVYSRCVRRAWLCGSDSLTGRSYEHRRTWIEERLLFLCERFAVELYSYAILSNHYHLVIRLDPLAPRRWPDADVAERWLELHPVRSGAGAEARHTARLVVILRDPTLLARYRERLGSLSWMMKLLNENIARRANREDGCKGRFWEGRFGSQALLDDRSLLAAAVYVDLNPVRAGASRAALTTPHTSIHRRLTRDRPKPASMDRLPPVAAGAPRADSGLPIGLAAYCELLLWTASVAYGGQASDRPPPDDSVRVGGAPSWFARLAAMRHRDRRAFGDPPALERYRATLGGRWLRGIVEARRIAAAATQPGPMA
jgi:hypothetical protein